MRKLILEKDKKFAVARILAGKSTSAREAAQLGVSPQAVRKWVREMRPPASPAPDPVEDPAEPEPVPEGSPGAAPDPAVVDPLVRAREAARAAAGLKPSGSGSGLPPPEALRAAEEADKQLVVQTAIDAKRGVLQFVAAKAGLPGNDPDLEKISGLTPLLASALQANASWIAPIIREKLQGKFALVIAVAIDGVLTLAALKEILKARGLVKEKPKKEEPPEGPEKPEEPKP
jgi:transposase-like protein